MKKFKLSLIALFCCALLVLTGCGLELVDAVDFSKSQQKTETITVWLDDSDGLFMKELIPAFNEEYPNIVVQFQHMSTVESRSKLKTYGKSGNGADVFQFAHDHLAPALLEDLLYPLSEDVQGRLEERIAELAMDIASVSFDETTKTFSSTGTKRLYAVPISIESVNLYYNKKLIDSVPTTMDDLIAAAKTFEADIANDGKKYFATSSHWADSYFNQYFLSAFGWRPFGKDGIDESKVGFESSNLENAITWMTGPLKEITTGAANHDSVQGGTMFQEGNCAILLTGPWSVNDMKKSNIDFGIAQMPTVTVNGEQVSGSTYAGSQMVAVYKHSSHIEAATHFVEFLASDTAAEILFRTSGDVPALKTELLNSIAGIKDDLVVQAITEQLKTSIPMPTIPSVAQYWTPAEDLMKTAWNNANPDIKALLNQAENSYLASKKLSGTN